MPASLIVSNSGPVAALVGSERSRPAAAGWLFLDALSGYHLLVLMAVYLLSSFAARGFFAPAGIR